MRDFGHAVANWRNPDLRGHRPTFKKRRLTGTGSFRAAGARREIHYDGKRRIRLPYLGSVKLAHTLPKGIIHEAHISFKNGQWLLSINYWKPPVEKNRARPLASRPAPSIPASAHTPPIPKARPGRTPRLITRPRNASPAGNAPKHAASAAPGAGGKHSAGLTACTAGSPACDATPPT